LFCQGEQDPLKVFLHDPQGARPTIRVLEDGKELLL
jgi:hypothetical protein